MNYTNQIKQIKSLLPNIDIVGEDELFLFENESFAKMCQDFFLTETKSLETRLNLKILFAFRNQKTFNAKAIKYQGENIILINVGLIDKIEKLVEKSVTYFCENINTIITGFTIPKQRLFKFYKSLIITYIFYHEIGHLLQINYADNSGNYSIKEEYDYEQPFDVKNHIYELDADHFGICISSTILLDYFRENNITEHMSIMNLTALFLFLISTVFIEFSNFSEKLYYKQFSHPHPAIRIVECNEQVLNMINNNIKVDKSLLLFSLKRTEILVDWFLQENGFPFKYSEMMNEKFPKVEKYGKEIEDLNEIYKELIRHRSQKIFDSIRR